MVNFDKFLASFITEMKECSQMRNFSVSRCIKKALDDQGLTYHDGKIVKNRIRVSAEAKENGYGESKDEKIRKEILEYFQQFENEELRGVDISNWIAWLEKIKR